MNGKLAPSLLIVTAAIVLCACREEPAAAPPRPIKLMTIGDTRGAITAELAGDVRARVESGLSFRVDGKIISRKVETGQHVRRGDELARLDPRDYQLSHKAAASLLIAAQTRLKNARAEYNRFLELEKKGYVSATELERMRLNLSTAEAQCEQAKSDRSLEQNRLADTVLRADGDGIVMVVLGDVGEVVGAGHPVIRLAQDGPREIEVEFPENRTDLARATRAEVSLWAKPDARLPATLRELSAAADPLTRTFRARYTVKAPADALALGQSATLHLTMPSLKGSGSRLPMAAVFGKDGRSLVWVYDITSSTVKQRAIDIIGADGNDMIVTGLALNEQVVTAGVHVLSEGQKVVPTTPTKL